MTDERAWFDEMAEAIRDRDKALAGIERWETKLTEAETKMATLAANSPISAPAADPAPAPAAPATVPSPTAAFVAPEPVAQ